MNLRSVFMLAIFLVLAALVALSLRNWQEPVPPAAADPSLPRYTLHDVQWTRLDEQGTAEFRIDAERAVYFDDRSARIEVVRLQVPGTGEPRWRARAPTAEVPAGEKRIHLMQSVDGEGHWDSGEPLRFHTPELWVEPEARRLYTDAGVTVVSESRDGTAQKLTANWRDETVNLSGRVKMRYGLH